MRVLNVWLTTTSKGWNLQVRPPGMTECVRQALLMYFWTLCSLWAAIGSKISREFFLKNAPVLVRKHLSVQVCITSEFTQLKHHQCFSGHGYPFKNNHWFQIDPGGSAGQHNGKVDPLVSSGINRLHFYAFSCHRYTGWNVEWHWNLVQVYEYHNTPALTELFPSVQRSENHPISAPNLVAVFV